MVPEFEDESVREIILDNYRFMYGLDDDSVLVIALIHGSRNLLRALRGRQPWDLG